MEDVVADRERRAAVVVLAEHVEIVVSYGTPAQLPRPLPSSFNFLAGL